MKDKLRASAFLSKAKIVFSVCFTLASLADAKIEAANKAESSSGRVPANLTDSYKKESINEFEATGLGEDFPELNKFRAPANDDSKEESPNTKEADMVTVKNQKDLENELQLQRRVDVFYEGRVRFKNGAAIWATEDASETNPKLEITTQNEVDVNSEEIRFQIFTNYLPFIKRWELEIFKMNKVGAEEVVDSLSGDSESLLQITYKLSGKKFKPGDVLFYKLKVFDEKDIFDILRTKRFVFIERPQNQNLTETNEDAVSDVLAEIWGKNAIEQQNISITGSKIRLVGNNLPRDYILQYRGQAVRVDEYGKFVIEEHFPTGKHQIKINIQDQSKKENFSVPFNLDISGKYFFVVGIADLRVGENKLSEKIATLGDDSEYDGNVFVDGRLAYFLKGRIKGKYLITSQLDTTEGDVSEIFKGLHRKNSEALFRRLDPDRYYPVYGDNSKTIEQAPTLGKFFVKIEVDQSFAMWGNANTNLSGTLLSAYNRTLYGGHLNYQSNDQTKFGDRKLKFTGFVSEPETLLGHNEFVGTGGRLFILRHNDVVQGSEKIVLEVRDRDSGILKEQAPLKPYADYEFDYLAGRVVLNQPLTTYVTAPAGEIIDPNGIGNNTYHLVVDYEYSDTGEGINSLTYGGRLEKWLGDRVSLAGTVVKEKRGEQTYDLHGLDTTFRIGQESFVKVERSETKNLQTSSNFTSFDGGLSFERKSESTQADKASAWAVESQVFLNDFVETKTEGVLSTWYRNYDAGFSTARRQTASDLSEYGFDLELNFNQQDVVKSKIVFSEEENNLNKSTFIGSYGRRFKKGSNVSAEYRVDKTERISTNTNEEGHLVGLRLGQRLTSGWSAYVKGQTSVKEEGGYKENDRYAIGTKFRISQKWDGSTEYSDGDRGEALVSGLSYNVEAGHQVYANLDKSLDSSTGPVSNGITLGQRKSFKNGVRLTTENQFEETAEEAGVKQLYGLDYNINRVLAINFSYQLGELENQNTGGITTKNAVSAGVVYTKDTDITASSKVSFLKDRGERTIDQFLITNSLKFRVGPSQTWFFEADYSLSENPLLAESTLARYTEANIGYALRPVTNDRFNFFARYTYLYDLDSQAQENARNDQRVHIASAEGSYYLNRRWELGSRLARKIGSERLGRDQGKWINATLTFAQMRLRYHLIKKWDALFEYRAVELQEAKDLQSGFLIGVDYHLGGNFKLGCGYNFTKFNDDLTNFSFESSGWFLNIVGKM
jgi:hypothetical protein